MSPTKHSVHGHDGYEVPRRTHAVPDTRNTLPRAGYPVSLTKHSLRRHDGHEVPRRTHAVPDTRNALPDGGDQMPGSAHAVPGGPDPMHGGLPRLFRARPAESRRPSGKCKADGSFDRRHEVPGRYGKARLTLPCHDTPLKGWLTSSAAPFSLRRLQWPTSQQTNIVIPARPCSISPTESSRSPQRAQTRN